jgi:hypothetical protein
VPSHDRPHTTPGTSAPWCSSPPSVLPLAPLTGSGCREHSYGGFGGGHPHFHPRAAPPVTRGLAAGNPRIKRQTRPVFKVSGSVWAFGRRRRVALDRCQGVQSRPSALLLRRRRWYGRRLYRESSSTHTLIVEYSHTHWCGRDVAVGLMSFCARLGLVGAMPSANSTRTPCSA